MSPWPPGATQATPVCTAQPPDICTAFRGNRSHRYHKPWLWWSHGPRSGLWQQLRPRWHHSPRWQRGHSYWLAPDSGHPLDPNMATGGSPEPKHRCGKHIFFFFNVCETFVANFMYRIEVNKVFRFGTIPTYPEVLQVQIQSVSEVRKLGKTLHTKHVGTS